jgi:hypothetical protein
MPVILRIAPGGAVEDHARASFLVPAGMGELEPQLRFADPGGADNHRQRSRHETAAEHRIQRCNSG